MKNSKTKTRREATPAQKEAAQARRDSLKLLAAKVKAMTPEQRVLIASKFGIVTAEGRPLSVWNSCFLITQNAHVSIVGGFNQWKAIGRVVKKGSKALAIWIPTGNTAAAEESPEITEGEEERKRFILGNVFDIADTETLTEFAARKDAAEEQEGAPSNVIAFESAANFQPALF